MRLAAPPPIVSLLAAAAVAVAASVAAVMLALSLPVLPLKLSAPVGAPAVTITGGPAAEAAGLVGGRLLSVGGVAIEPTDVLDEPDYLPDYAAARAFFARQTRLSLALQAPEVSVEAVRADGRPVTVRLAAPPRAPDELPFVFWVQIGFAVGSFLIAAWVWSLRPNDLAPRLFGLTGVGMLASATAAAIYSTRELAMDGGLFHVLSALNHGGPMLFGYAMLGLFLVYPRRLVSPKLIAAYAPVPALWFAADCLMLLPNANWGAGAPLLLHTLTIAVALVFQWRATRDDPVGRAAMRWFGVSVVVSALAAVGVVMMPSLTGRPPVMSQGYAFGFIFLIYVGLAVGLRRSRIFQLDEWAFRIAFYAGAGVLLLALDAGLILLLQTNGAASFGAALLAVVFLYLPLREVLWRRLVARRRIGDEELFGQIVDVALAVQPAERDERWRALLSRLFEPLHIDSSDTPRGDIEILDDGITLAMPAVGASPPLVLRAPWSGRGLFGPSHLRLARRAMDMVVRTETRRDDYERGAAEERVRIAQDLHDDVGALLLSGLHKPDLDNTRRVIRDAIFDVRMLASELGGERRAVGDLLADLRHESLERLEGAGLAVDWPPAGQDAPTMMDFAVYKAVRSSVRELVSNVIRHAGAGQVTVGVRETPEGVVIEIADDGRGMAGGARRGMGLNGVARRMGAVAGSLELPPQPLGSKAVLAFPLQRSA